MGEQRKLLEEMLAQAEIRVKEVGEKLAELETRQDLVGLEGTILESVLRLGATWMGMILSLWAANLAAKAGTRRVCACEGLARWVELRAKTILTLFGRVTYQRVYYHCKQCHQGEALGDRRWGLEHTRTSPAVKQLLGYVSASIPGFSAAAKLVCRTLQWSETWLSGKQVQRLAEPIGTKLGEAEGARIARWWAQVTQGLAGSLAGRGREAYQELVRRAQEQPGERLYVQMDGVMARLRGTLGKGSDLWREVKVGAIFWAQSGRHATKLVALVSPSAARSQPLARTWVDGAKGPITYVASLLTAADFGVRIYAEAVLRGVERAKQVVILGDGAVWIWKLAEEHFPEAVQILDFWHASEWVWKVAKAVWGEGSAKATLWAETQIAERLLVGDVVGLVTAIAALPQVPPPPEAKKSVPEQALGYFQHNAERMRYPEYRARGLEIGSGTVESAGKRVVGQRCKGPGMRWHEAGLAAILSLRTDVLNDRYDLALADLQEAA